MKMLLIAGHGAGDPGAVATIGGKTYKEADETRLLAPMIAGMLKGYADVTVYDTARNAFADVGKGVLTAADFEGYDYVLELHFNALVLDSDGQTKGVECYVTTSESGTAVEAGICANIAALGLTNRGVKRKNWTVIQLAKRAGVSSALLEVCFIDDADDMAVYIKDRQSFADAVARGVIEGFGLAKRGEGVKLQRYGAYFENIERIAYIPMQVAFGETVSVAATRVTWNGRAPDVIFNAELFDMETFVPASGVVHEGTERYLPPVLGAALVDNKKPVLSFQNNLKADDWIGAYPMLVRDGKQAFTAVPAGLGGERARICLAWNDGQAAVCYVRESDGCTLEDFAAAVIGAGYHTAINLDGGGSVACVTPVVAYEQGRRVRGKIGIWIKDGKGNLLAQKEAASAAASGTASSAGSAAPVAVSGSAKVTPMQQDKSKAGGVRLTVTAKSGLRLRKSAPDGDTIDIYAKGSTVTWYGYYTTATATGAVWYYVRAEDGSQGYMAAEYLA